MRYMFLLYGDESQRTVPGTPEWRELMQEYAAFASELERRGLNHPPRQKGPVLGDPIAADGYCHHGARSEWPTLISDGPFAETKEQLGGYYIIDGPDLDARPHPRAMILTSRGGSVEVRPILEMMQD